jgi:hypothetical protein
MGITQPNFLCDPHRSQGRNTVDYPGSGGVGQINGARANGFFMNSSAEAVLLSSRPVVVESESAEQTMHRALGMPVPLDVLFRSIAGGRCRREEEYPCDCDPSGVAFFLGSSFFSQVGRERGERTSC